MALESSYTGQSAGQVSSGSQTDNKGQYWSLSKLRKAYTDYLFSKREEIDEQKDARRYYNASQWTSEQLEVLRKRKQPAMTVNMIGPKINGVVGLIEKLRQDPKAFARTPKHEEGAELATAVIRYCLDNADWGAKSPIVALTGAVDGIGGIVIELEEGDNGDREVSFDVVDIPSFFYDPRSYKYDFSDAQYMGEGKWIDIDTAKDMFPDADESAFQSDEELTNDSDREKRWFSSDGVNKYVRIIDIWYKHKRGWCWAIFSGNAILMEGKSYLQDENDDDMCRYVMFSGNTDQDGDRYGFVRNLKSVQDGINAKHSKLQHILASKRIFLTNGAVQDIEVTRREAARPDGVVLVNGKVGEALKVDDQATDYAGWEKLLVLNQSIMDNFGPSYSLIGQTADSGAQSGRAIALLQQAGMAQLGPYILGYKGWKVRVYRAIWNAVQRHWQAERWVRVTDDEGLAQYIQINGMQIDPTTGRPAIVNAIGQLDVDIIIDEGPDTINAMQDMYETLSNVVPSIAPLLKPQQAAAVVNMLVETSPLPATAKKKWREANEAAAQPDPIMEQGKMAELQKAIGEAQQKQADAKLKEAQTAKTYVEAQMHPQAIQNEGLAAMFGEQPGQQEFELPPELQHAQAMAEIENTQADTAKKYADAGKVQTETALAPHQMMMEQHNNEIERAQAQMNADADRQMNMRNADADRNVKAQQAKKSQAQR